jgi:LysR family hydrogen peroxide-inducible transcriptional activator
VALARSQVEPLSGRLNFGVIPTIAPFLLPRFIPVLHDRLPRLELYLREDTTANLLAALQDGDLDLLLLALPYKMRQVEIMRLFRDPFRLACRQGTTRVDPHNYRFDRLQRDSVLLLEDGHCLRDHALAACRIRKQEKVSRFAASSLLTLVQMVNADLGITYLPALAEGSALLADSNVKTYRLEESAYREVGLVWRSGGARDQEYRSLGNIIRECRPNPSDTPNTEL